MISGSIVALVTPFNVDGSIDFVSLGKLLELHNKCSDGVVLLGSTGESHSLSEEEKLEVIAFGQKYKKPGCKLIIGAGSASTQATLTFIDKMQQFAIDALMVVTPYYIRPTQAGLYLHYKEINQRSKLPIIIYNVPSRTGVCIDINTIARLSYLENIVGLKDATANLNNVPQLRALCSDNFWLLSGDDLTACAFVENGGNGVVSVAANVIPRQMKLLMNLALQHKKQAAQLYSKLYPLFKYLSEGTNPEPCKALMGECGMINNILRLPLLPYNHSDLDVLCEMVVQDVNEIVDVAAIC